MKSFGKIRNQLRTFLACLLASHALAPFSLAQESSSSGRNDDALLEGGLKWLVSRQGSDGGWWTLEPEKRPGHGSAPACGGPVRFGWGPASWHYHGGGRAYYYPLSSESLRQLDARQDAFDAIDRTVDAVTALVKAGNLPGEGEYGAAVQRGRNFLLHAVAGNGLLFGGGLSVEDKLQNGACGAEMHYSMGMHHSVIVLLCGLYGNGKEPGEKEAIQKLLAASEGAQSAGGGWSADLPQSISQADLQMRQHFGAQPNPFSTLAALKAFRAAIDAGFRVNPEVLKKAASFVGPPSPSTDPGEEYRPYITDAVPAGSGEYYWYRYDNQSGRDKSLLFSAAILSALAVGDHYMEELPVRPLQAMSSR